MSGSVTGTQTCAGSDPDWPKVDGAAGDETVSGSIMQMGTGSNQDWPRVDGATAGDETVSRSVTQTGVGSDLDWSRAGELMAEDETVSGSVTQTGIGSDPDGGAVAEDTSSTMYPSSSPSGPGLELTIRGVRSRVTAATSGTWLEGLLLPGLGSMDWERATPGTVGGTSI